MNSLPTIVMYIRSQGPRVESKGKRASCELVKILVTSTNDMYWTMLATKITVLFGPEDNIGIAGTVAERSQIITTSSSHFLPDPFLFPSHSLSVPRQLSLILLVGYSGASYQ